VAGSLAQAYGFPAALAVPAIAGALALLAATAGRRSIAGALERASRRREIAAALESAVRRREVAATGTARDAVADDPPQSSVATAFSPGQSW
jgi:hypothetical protein